MSKSVVLTLIITCGIVVASGCRRGTGDEFFAQNQNPYFPIRKGNVWKYSNQVDSIVVRVLDYAYDDGRWFAQLERVVEKHGQQFVQWKAYWTYGDSGKVEVFDNLGVIGRKGLRSVYYYTAADSGTSWDMNSSIIYRVVMLSRHEILAIRGNRYADCLEYYIEGMGAGEGGYDYLARGIGLVKMGRYEIYDYKIN